MSGSLERQNTEERTSSKGVVLKSHSRGRQNCHDEEPQAGPVALVSEHGVVSLAEVSDGLSVKNSESGVAGRKTSDTISVRTYPRQMKMKNSHATSSDRADESEDVVLPVVAVDRSETPTEDSVGDGLVVGFVELLSSEDLTRK